MFFGDSTAKTVDAVWAQWDQIKKSEKQGTLRERTSALDGIPKHLPALLRAEKLVKKARKAKLFEGGTGKKVARENIGKQLFELAAAAQEHGWSAEELLRKETARRERVWRKSEGK